MTSGLRRVELQECRSESDSNIQGVDHVVGVDESGNTSDSPLVMVAVQCPRSKGELLAELLIELGLGPWKSKSSSSPAGMSDEDLSESVEDLIERLNDHNITWHAVAGWGEYNKEQRGAISCVVTSKAMTGGSSNPMPEYEGPAVMLHDGGTGFYGNDQITLRRYASRQFSGFHDRVTPIYIAHLFNGDKTYPEITTADYLAGYFRSIIPERGIEGASFPIQRIDPSWRSSDEPPVALYRLRTRNRRRQIRREERAAAWIEGRRPPENNGWDEQPIETLIGRLESETVRDYILNQL